MDAKQEKCVIYSFGVNDKSSFEAALLERAPGCEVWSLALRSKKPPLLKEVYP
ncbi:hypothetical protein EDB83DRAFT_2477182 [Lactarius deliciosus]|nr:hypothetical protein EDB83DRAFT_2477182 [Lactarius deliciosus]